MRDTTESKVDAAVSTGVARPKTVAERFGAKISPFAMKTTGQVSRSADFRRISTLPRRETWEDQSEALTLAFAKPALPPNTCPPRCPCGQTGAMRLRPQQAWALSEFFAQRGGIACLGPGAGKAQPLDSLVYTTSGPKRMGDMGVGDIVCTPDGGKASVVGIFPQGVKQIFKVTFSDGSHVECCDEHLWNVRDKRQRKNTARNKSYVPLSGRAQKKGVHDRPEWQTLPLKQIRKELVRFDGFYDIPVTKPVLFEQGDALLIPAYTLGVLLGDGSLKNPACIVHTGQRDGAEMRKMLDTDCTGFPFHPAPSKDFRKIPINNRVRFHGSAATHADTIQNRLKSLKLAGTGSETKFIPEAYKYSSVENRIALLSGLLDTDGTVGRRGGVSYTTISPVLAQDVCSIVQSLGGTATVSTRKTKYTYKGEVRTGKLSFTLFIRMPGNIVPVRLSFKVARWRPLTKYAPVRYIRSVESVGLKEAQCIMLDSKEHLYLTNGYAVTHNTILSLLLAPLMGWQRAILLVPAGLRDKTVNIDYPLLSRHWHLPPLEGKGNLEIRSYEELSRENFADYLSERRIPDGIIADECHRISHRGSGRTKRLMRHFAAYGDTEFVGMSGSIVHRSVMDYGHLYNLALKDASPLPHSFIELKTWADTLDEGIPEYARPKAGALMDFCKSGETVRDGYRRRMLDTKAIVSSPDLSTNIGLNISEIKHPMVPKIVVEAFHRLRNTKELPGGEVATTALDQIRHARELFLGFYLRWVWPDGVVDTEWLKKRKAWRSYVRKMTTRSHKGLWLDTEAQVAKAIVQGKVECREDEKTATGGILRSNVDVYAEWVYIRENRKPKWGGKREPPKKVEWLSDYMLIELERWSKENLGIVWIENIGFMDKLRERGNVCFGAGENDIEKESGKRSVFASFAHATGRNLQIWNRMVFSNPLSSGKATEQALGREHRPGCMAYSKTTKKMEVEIGRAHV